MNEEAIEHLKLAIDLHRAHMDGAAPTSQESQMELMEHLEAALTALGGQDDSMDQMRVGYNRMSAK